MFMELVGSGKYSDIFKVQGDQGSLAMKVSYYSSETIEEFVSNKKNGDSQGARCAKERDSISVSEFFSKITERLAVEQITPHYVTVYAEHDVKNFVYKIPVLSDRLALLNKYQKHYNHVTFMELFDGDMTGLLTKNHITDDVLRPMIFHILYTIAVTQKYLHGFRHNDLSTNNVLVKKVTPSWHCYNVGGNLYYTKCPYFVAITDYDFVHAPNSDARFLRNMRIYSGNYKLKDDRNDSYDIHLFLKSISKCLDKMPSEYTKHTRSFLNSLELHVDDRYQLEIKSLIPRSLLSHDYFTDLMTYHGKSVGVATTFKF